MKKLRANTFEIGFPEGWLDGSTVTMISPLRSNFSPNVQVHQEPVPADRVLADHIASQRRELQQLEGFRFVEHGDRKLGAQPALYHVYEWRTPQGLDIRQLQVFSVRAGVLYTVTASAAVGEWATVDAAFDLIIAGFQFV